MALQVQPTLLESLTGAFSASVATNEKPWCPPGTDKDGDKICDLYDNCPDKPNADQADKDNDRLGDVCDTCNDLDVDGDGVPNDEDKCREVADPRQGDVDNDGIGDHCDTDADNDGCPNYVSLRDSIAGACFKTTRKWTIRPGDDRNPARPSGDADRDGISDDCDPIVKNLDDRDEDGIPNDRDNCPDNPNPSQANVDNDDKGDICDSCNNDDVDGDGRRNATDNCSQTPNNTQNDVDRDGLGDICDDDVDGDGCLNEYFEPEDRGDGCFVVRRIRRLVRGASQDPRLTIKSKDTDGDGLGDDCDALNDVDGDIDGILNNEDNCPTVKNSKQEDFDNDGKGDACDLCPDNDIDRDGVLNDFTNKDGIFRAGTDNCPEIPNSNQQNSDGIADGGDVCDEDADNDGCYNSVQIPIPIAGREPCVRVSTAKQYQKGINEDGRPTQKSLDKDNDGRGDVCDKCNDRDRDGDGVLNEYVDEKGDIRPSQDNCESIPNKSQRNLDGDAFGNECDADADGDGFPNPTITPKTLAEGCTTWNGSWAQWHKDALSLSGNDRFPGDPTRH